MGKKISGFQDSGVNDVSSNETGEVGMPDDVFEKLVSELENQFKTNLKPIKVYEKE